MPELPEVETIVSDLGPILKGQSFLGIHADYLPAVLPHLKAFNVVKGVAVTDVKRRGKFINIFFDNEQVMTIHLRMSGRLIVQKIGDEALQYERTRINFHNASLRFCDVRKFGKVWINHVKDFESKTGISRLGIEPFDEQFSLDWFISNIKGKNGVVKKILLDQSVIAGIGNIYADEACFYAGIRPDSEIKKLNKERLEKLFNSILKALSQGIRNRGTSISDFTDAYGSHGTNQELLYVYGRGGNQCLECKSILKKIKLVGRGTVFCPKCQSI